MAVSLPHLRRCGDKRARHIDCGCQPEAVKKCIVRHSFTAFAFPRVPGSVAVLEPSKMIATQDGNNTDSADCYRSHPRSIVQDAMLNLSSWIFGTQRQQSIQV